MPSFMASKKKLKTTIDQKDPVFFKVIFFLPKNTSKKVLKISKHTVDGRHPAPVDRLFIPLFTRGLYNLYPSAGFLPSTVSWQTRCLRDLIIIIDGDRFAEVAE